MWPREPAGVSNALEAFGHDRISERLHRRRRGDDRAAAKGPSEPGVATPSFVQEAAIEAWSDEEHVADQRRIYREKRDVLLPLLKRKGLTIGGTEATFYLWFAVPERWQGSSEAFATSLLERGIVITPGVYFGAAGEGWARMALVPTLEQCHAAAAILEELL
ncbi:MAG: aminotransferase class I/II-fold pyridoxal phosphate-dependent enzyme [Candidatus Eisenbacteria bacterium]